MSETPESKPLEALSAFADSLGWAGLEMKQTCPPGDTQAITWYVARTDPDDIDLPFLQINECPLHQTRTFTCAVHALGVGIHTGWHSMRVDDTSSRQFTRLASWLHRDLFQEDALRAEFLQQHPECGGWTWERLRSGPPGPYIVIDGENCVTGPARRAK